MAREINGSIRAGGDGAGFFFGWRAMENGPNQIAILIIFLNRHITVALIKIAAEVAIGADRNVDGAIDANAEIFAVGIAGYRIADDSCVDNRTVAGLEFAQESSAWTCGIAVTGEAGDIDEAIVAYRQIHAVVLIAAADARGPDHIPGSIRLDHKGIGRCLLGRPAGQQAEAEAGGIADAVDRTIAWAHGQRSQQIPRIAPELQSPVLLAAAVDAAQEAIAGAGAEARVALHAPERAAAEVNGAEGIDAQAPDLIILVAAIPLGPQPLTGEVVSTHEAIASTPGRLAVPAPAIGFPAEIDGPIATAGENKAGVIRGPTEEFQPIQAR